VVDLADEAAQDGDLRVVPTTALFIGKDAAELSVIRELEAIGQLDLDGTALQALLDPESLITPAVGDAADALADGPAPEPARPDDWHDDIEVLELTDTQRKVVSRARTERLTVVTGPPGTGKSYSITALVLDHVLAGRTVLVTSGTPKAVEVVVSGLEKLGGPFLVATSGDRAHQRELAKRIDKLTSPKSAPAWYPDSELQAGRDRYYAMRTEVQNLEERLAETLAHEGALAFHLSAVEGLEHLVVLFDLETVRRSPAELDQLRQRTLIEPDAGWFKRWRANRALESLRRELRAKPGVEEKLLPDAINFVDHRNELAEVSAALDASPDLLGGWNKLAEARQALLDHGAVVLGMQRQTELARLLNDQSSRLALKKFSQALRATQHKPKKELLAQVPVEVLLRAFPCWASTDRFLSHILPLRKALFDLVVIDEASQVDLAAASPSLYRGERAVIVGDPNQLRFVCFLSTAAETAAFSRQEVPAAYQVTHRFSRNSLFDTAERAVAQRNSLMLDEHFRSQPHIISFSNVEFYGRALRIMTERPHSSGAKTVDVEYVGGRREVGQARNDAEVEAAIKVARTYVDLANQSGKVQTLGLLSPYRDQANALAKAVSERFSPNEIARHQITCGTAHSLQGDERDVVVFSTVIDGNFNPTSLRFLEDPNVFNVAITRAASRLVCVTSVKPDQLPSGEARYLKKFLLHAENVSDPGTLPDTFDSRFEADVALALRDRGYRVISHYPSCGYSIDLVLSDGTRSIAIECDGHPSHFRSDGSYTTEDIQRHVDLWRSGWDIYRIPLSTWRSHAEGHIEGAINLLENPVDRQRREIVLPKPRRVTPTGSTQRGPQTARPAKRSTARKRPTVGAQPHKVSVTTAMCSCGGSWVLRTGRYGRFYGCSRFPRCRRTKSYA
jgi:hypothetical protein